MSPLSRRAFLAGLGSTATAFALSGCITNSGNKSASSSNSKTITLMNWEAEEGSPYPDVFAAFEKATGYTIDYQFAASGSDYWPKTRTVLGSNNPPDLMRIDDDFVAYYASTGKLLDLRDFVKQSNLNEADYYPAVFNNTRQPDGRIVGWSLGLQPRVIFYNKTMFQRAGVALPPTSWTDAGWTWDDFVAAAKKLTVPGKQYGACVVDDSGYEVIYSINNGGSGRWSKDGSHFALADPPDAQAVQWAADLTCTQHVQPEWSQIKQSGRGQAMFAAGQIAMIERPSSLLAYFQKNVKGFDWDIAPVPGNKQQATYGNQIVFSIPAAAGNKTGAWKLLQFLTTMDGAKYFAQQGSFVPGFKAAAALIKPSSTPPQNITLILDAVDKAVLPGRVVQDEQAVGIYRPALDPVLSCQTPASKALTAIRGQVDTALKG